MSRRRIIFAAILILAVTVGGIFTWLALNAVPETSQVLVSEKACESDDAEKCILFPTVTGNNLNGRAFTLPDDLHGDYHLVVIPFDRDQQTLAETWLPFAKALVKEYPSLTYYDVPIFPDLSDALRLVIQTGMNVLIHDDELREDTILVYLEDRDTFLEVMQIPDVEQIQVFLLDAEADVLWRGIGEFSDEQSAQLEQALSEVARSS